MSGIVIIGAGHAGVQAAASLRDEGYDGALRLIDAGSALPYQRPPLSKAYMKGQATADSLVLRGEGFYAEKRIDLILGTPVTGLDRAARRLQLAGGEAVEYDQLILAPGAMPRPLSIGGADAPNVVGLRDLADAERLKLATEKASRIVVIGAGFIGLEYAAVAAAMSKQVTVLEAAPRVMARAISPAMSEAFARMHAHLGIHLKLKSSVRAIVVGEGMAKAVETADGEKIPADLVVVGIGILPDDRLARMAGLSIDNGIVVDASMMTTDPHIFAVGDATSHPNPYFGGRLRLESVQNAVDQAKTAARALLGRPSTYHAVPWFWSDQADWKLQIAGIAPAIEQYVLRGDPESGAFSVFGYAGDRLVVVESVNRPGEHMAARKLIGEGKGVSPQEAADPSFDLKSALSR